MIIPLDAIVTFVLASAVLSIAPGPDNLFVLAQSALYGKRSGILITLGLATGLVVHTLAVALGVAAIIQTSTLAFTALKLAGGFYLAYLAWQAFTTSAAQLQSADNHRLTAMALYRRGIIMNLTNPKVSIFFLAFLPQFAVPERGPLVWQLLLLGGLFIITALVIFCLIAVLAGMLGHWLQQSPRARLYLHRIAGTVLAALALKLLASSAAAV